MASQIGLVQQNDGVLVLQAQVNDGLVFLRQPLRTVADEEHQVGVFDSILGALNADGFHGVFGLPDARGVNKPQPGGAQHDGFFHGVPGGAGNVGDDGPVEACQGI